MKISVNDQELFTLTETQKSVIKYDVNADIFDQDMLRRLKYILTHKYERSFHSLKKEWDTKLKENGVKSVPTDEDEYAQLVFAQPNYKCRKTRELESKLAPVTPTTEV
jgi:hypothetical protein